MCERARPTDRVRVCVVEGLEWTWNSSFLIPDPGSWRGEAVRGES